MQPTEDLVFRVSGVAESPARFRAQTRRFTVIVDEPEELGGTDEAPNPVEYVLIGFGGCLNVMAHLIAQELGFTIRRLEIELKGTLNPDRLFGRSKAERAGYKHIEAQLKIDADADKTLLQEWLTRINDRCPVNDNLSNPTSVMISVTSLKSETQPLT
jgi:uncharacterized OsmC-like protein